MDDFTDFNKEESVQKYVVINEEALKNIPAVENVEIKKSIIKQGNPHDRPQAEVSANTSGVLSGSTLEGEWRLASALAKSGFFKEEKFANNPAAILAAMQNARELGLPVLGTLNRTAMINGRPTVWGDAFKGLVFRKAKELNIDLIQYHFEGENLEELLSYKPGEVWRAVVRIRRRSPECEFTAQFSVDDAKRAGLWDNPKKQVWAAYPEVMLMNRAFSIAARFVCPDAIMGLDAEDHTDYVEQPQATAKSKLEAEYGDRQEVQGAGK